MKSILLCSAPRRVEGEAHRESKIVLSLIEMTFILSWAYIDSVLWLDTKKEVKYTLGEYNSIIFVSIYFERISAL
jgi:hypothetical protein